jgi:protein involved in polysaccharide export with SLBB domain
VSDAINSPGTPLPDGDRSLMENRFGYDFSGVRIHTSALAAKSAQSINALAYTSGNNVVFNEGQYAPQTESGKKLLAHELTHVIQQNSDVKRKGTVQRQEMDEAEQLQNKPAQLRSGQVVRVEVRSGGGDIQPMTHNYPVSPNGCVTLPMVGCMMAAGKTTTQLRSDIEQALLNGFFRIATVNVSLLAGKTVDYSHAVAAGESIFIRVLGSSGEVEFEGNFPVDSTGQIHIPMVGALTVQGQNFATIESTIQSRLITGDFLRSPTVHVADSRI